MAALFLLFDPTLSFILFIPLTLVNIGSRSTEWIGMETRGPGVLPMQASLYGARLGVRIRI